MSLPVECSECDGRGTCMACDGVGHDPERAEDNEDSCMTCGGDGICQECMGIGEVHE